jgi:hypothetical protein
VVAQAPAARVRSVTAAAYNGHGDAARISAPNRGARVPQSQVANAAPSRPPRTDRALPGALQRREVPTDAAPTSEAWTRTMRGTGPPGALARVPRRLTRRLMMLRRPALAGTVATKPAELPASGAAAAAAGANAPTPGSQRKPAKTSSALKPAPTIPPARMQRPPGRQGMVLRREREATGTAGSGPAGSPPLVLQLIDRPNPHLLPIIRLRHRP